MADRLMLLAFRTAWTIFPRISERITKPLVRLIADLMWLRNGKGVRQLQQNLSRVTSAESDTVRALTREGVRNYAEYWRTLFQLSAWPLDRIMSSVVFHNVDRVDYELATGRGVVIASTHSGNWDIGGIAVATRFNGVTTVAERLKPEELFQEFVARRAPYGFDIIPHRGGARPAIDVLKDRIREGKLVALVSDRDLSRRGVDVTFFGGRARMAAGPAVLASETGAALIPCAVWVEGDIVHVLAHEPLTVPEGVSDVVPYLTQRLADVYARDIAAHPADWHMLQPVWVD